MFAAFSPGSSKIPSGPEDKSIRLWDANTGEGKGSLGGHTDSVSAVAFSPDGKTIVSGSRDKSSRQWDAMNGQSKSNTERRRGFPQGDKPAPVYLRADARMGQPQTDAVPVESVAFSPNERTAASGYSDATIRCGIYEQVSRNLMARCLKDTSTALAALLSRRKGKRLCLVHVMGAVAFGM
jgi:WD40 repeat protein